MTSKVLLLLLILAAVFLSGRFVGKSQTEFTDSESAVIEAVKRVKPAVVGIKTYRGVNVQSPVEVASGVLFRPDGYILTNSHVLKKANRVQVIMADGKKYEAALVSAADEYDLAVLKISGGRLPIVVFGDSDKLELGQIAIAIGNPLSFGWTVTQGVISALNRRVTVRHLVYQHLIQTDAAINPGNSGGPLVSSSGQVIGINTLVYENPNLNAQGLGFAIPSNTVKEVANAIFEKARTLKLNPKVRLGLSLYDLTQQLAMQQGLPVVRGVVIERVESGGPADQWHMMSGDVITKVDNQPIVNSEQLIHIIGQKSPGATLTFEIWRKGLKGILRVQLEGLPH